MDETTKSELIAELAALCRKYGVSIYSSADSADDPDFVFTELESWIEVIRLVEREGRFPAEEILFKCDGINGRGIF